MHPSLASGVCEATSRLFFEESRTGRRARLAGLVRQVASSRKRVVSAACLADRNEQLADTPDNHGASPKPTLTLSPRLPWNRPTYVHALNGHQAIVDWFMSTGLKPYVDPLSSSDRVSYLDQYRAKISQAYPLEPDGKVLLRFPRLFILARRS